MKDQMKWPGDKRDVPVCRDAKEIKKSTKKDKKQALLEKFTRTLRTKTKRGYGEL